MTLELLHLKGYWKVIQREKWTIVLKDNTEYSTVVSQQEGIAKMLIVFVSNLAIPE